MKQNKIDRLSFKPQNSIIKKNLNPFPSAEFSISISKYDKSSPKSVANDKIFIPSST